MSRTARAAILAAAASAVGVACYEDLRSRCLKIKLIGHVIPLPLSYRNSQDCTEPVSQIFATAVAPRGFNVGMARFGSTACSQIGRIALLGAFVAFLVAMLLSERLNLAEFALLSTGTIIAVWLGPSIDAEALHASSRSQRDNWATLRASPMRGIPRGILTLLFASWAVTIGLVLLSYATSVRVPLPLDSAVSGSVLLIAVLQVSLSVWLRTRNRRRA